MLSEENWGGGEREGRDESSLCPTRPSTAHLEDDVLLLARQAVAAGRVAVAQRLDHGRLAGDEVELIRRRQGEKGGDGRDAHIAQPAHVVEREDKQRPRAVEDGVLAGRSLHGGPRRDLQRQQQQGVRRACSGAPSSQ